MDTIDTAKDTLKCVWKCIRCSNWPAENTHKPHTQWSMCWGNFQLCSYIFCTHSTCLTRQHYQRARLEKKIFIYKLRQKKQRGWNSNYINQDPKNRKCIPLNSVNSFLMRLGSSKFTVDALRFNNSSPFLETDSWLRWNSG